MGNTKVWTSMHLVAKLVSSTFLYLIHAHPCCVTLGDLMLCFWTVFIALINLWSKERELMHEFELFTVICYFDISILCSGHVRLKSRDKMVRANQVWFFICLQPIGRLLPNYRVLKLWLSKLLAISWENSRVWLSEPLPLSQLGTTLSRYGFLSEEVLIWQNLPLLLLLMHIPSQVMSLVFLTFRKRPNFLSSSLLFFTRSFRPL